MWGGGGIKGGCTACSTHVGGRNAHPWRHACMRASRRTRIAFQRAHHLQRRHRACPAPSPVLSFPVPAPALQADLSTLKPVLRSADSRTAKAQGRGISFSSNVRPDLSMRSEDDQASPDLAGGSGSQELDVDVRG